MQDSQNTLYIFIYRPRSPVEHLRQKLISKLDCVHIPTRRST